MSSAVSLRPEMGEPILAHLGKMAKLPKFGVVAGQAVASAIEDLWGVGGGVYNDLDVFIPCSGRFTSKEPKANHMPTRCEAVALSRSGYGGSVQRHLEMVQTYRIEEVRYKGLVNKVYFSLPDAYEVRAADHAERVIGGFDINAVRVGIDLRTRKLVWDSHYEQFLADRELRIAACYTPAHSMVRLLKKAQELPDVTVDVETAARITAMLQMESLYKQLNSSKLVSYLFGDKFTKLALAHKSQWDAYYELGDEWFHLATSTSPWRRGCGDETTIDVKQLHSMTPRGELDATDQAFARELGVSSVVALPAQVYRHRNSRRNGFVGALGLPETPELYADTYLPHYAKVRGADYYDGVDTEDQLEQLRRFSNSSWARQTMGWSGLEQLLFEQGVDALARSLGVPDAESLLTQLAGDVKPLTIERLETAARKLIEDQRKPVHRHNAPLPNISTCEIAGADGLELFELLSVREMEEFNVSNTQYLHEHDGAWRHRYFVVRKIANPKTFGVVQVPLDADSVMSEKMKLLTPISRYTPEGRAEVEMLENVREWLRIQWAWMGQLKEYQGPDCDLPF